MKAIKKALALCLALAMVVTAVPVSTADAAVKTAKLSKSSVTVAGNATKKQTKSVKVTTNADWKNVKVTASSADKKVATVAVSKKTVKVTAVKKGETKVTVKVTGKKSGKAVSKKLTLKVTVCGAGLAVKAPAELTVGDTTKLAVKTTPSTASCTFDVDKAEVATVSDNGTITAVAPGTAKVVVRTDYGKEKTVTVKVTEKKSSLAVASLEVKAADTLVATFAQSVDKDNVTLSLKRGTTSVEFTPEWTDTNVVVLKASANYAAGTYELTVTDKNDENNKETAKVAVEARKASQIVITNDVALTAKSNPANDKLDVAYAYYDVVDQYGVSMRNSVSIEWAGSVAIQANATRGELKLTRTDTNAFTYGEQIFITGVYAKTGLSVNKTLTVGTQQAVNAVELVGFVKKGTTEIIKALPADFKDLAYYLLYNVTDQNGNTMKANKNNANEVTFISDSPLVISNISKAGDNVFVNGVEYSAVLVEPGIKVEQGGEVNVKAIANKTGNSVVLNVPVNVSDVLQSFVIEPQADIISDGSVDKYGNVVGVELSFAATDAKGNKITNFEVIAKQKTFNKLQLTTNAGSITLSQKDDGTAKLTFVDELIPWNSSLATDGQDRIVSLTAIVIGGETNNQMLYISDKARPAGVKQINNFDPAYVENDSKTIYLAHEPDCDVWYGHKGACLTYVDQYGRELSAIDAKNFFDAAKTAGTLKGTDFDGYVFGVMVTYAGNGNSTLVKADGATQAAAITGVADKAIFLTATDGSVKVNMVKPDGTTNVTSAVASGENLVFSLAKVKGGKYSLLDTGKSASYSVVDITKVQGFTVDDFAKAYVKTNYSSDPYITNVAANAAPTGAAVPASHKVTATVKGTYAGKSINIPKAYYLVYGDKLTTTGGDNTTGIKGNNELVNVATSLLMGDLYNYSGVDYTKDNVPRKDATGTVTVEVYELYGGSSKVATIVKPITISDAAPYAAKINGGGVTKTVNPEDTAITEINGPSWGRFFKVVDQYGKDFTCDLNFEVKNIKENAAAYADNNFTVSSNSSPSATITGAERGDTYTLRAYYGTLEATIEVTVGADKKAYINQAGNNYLDDLVKNKLEPQRKTGLGL